MSQPAAARPPDAPSLTTRAIRGVAWTLPTSLAARGIGLVGTLLLARYVSPAEYGEVSAAFILTLTANSVTTFGVGIYLVTHRELTRADAFHATCWFLATGVAALALVWGLSAPLGAWLGAPHLTRFMPVLVLGALLDRIASVPERMLVRELRFGWLSVARTAAELSYTGVSLGLAVLGDGAMAIAWGNLVRSALRFVAIVPAPAWRSWLEPHRLRLSTLGAIVSHGVKVSLTFIATFAMRRWDNLLVSRYFGPVVMGGYNYAYNLADTPAVAIGEQMSDVISASFPHVDRERRATALVRSCTMISVVMLPLAFGLAAVAHTVVQTFLDQRWAEVGGMLAILAVLSATRPMAHVLQAYFYACQRPGVVLWMEWVSLAAIVAGIATVGRLGVGWTCGAVGTVFVLRSLIALWMAHRLDGIPISRFLRPLLVPLLTCLAMVAAIAAARPGLAHLAPAHRLVVEVALGAAVYLGGALVAFPATARDFVALVRSALSSRT
jgi:PST family polysaccharide transporter